MSVIAVKTKLFKVTMTDQVKNGNTFTFTQEYTANSTFDARVKAYSEYGTDGLGRQIKTLQVTNVEEIVYKG